MTQSKTVNNSQGKIYMRACATSNGGVMFIPDHLEAEKTTPHTPLSYKDLEPASTEKPSAFGRLEKIARKIANFKKAA